MSPTRPRILTLLAATLAAVLTGGLTAAPAVADIPPSHSVTVTLLGPGATAANDSSFGQLVVDYWTREEGGEWSEATRMSRSGTFVWFDDDVPWGGVYLRISREGNPYFEPVEELFFMEEGTHLDVEYWMPNSLTVQAGTFEDVFWNHQFFEEILWMYDQGITTGVVGSDGYRRYQPDAPVSRAAMAAFIYRSAGKPAFTAPATASFADVPTGHQFFREIEWMKSVGITTGTTIGGQVFFKPEDDVNRRDMAAFLYRSQGSPAFASPTVPPFWDVPIASQFAKEIAWLKSVNVARGNPDGSYAPASSIHRAAMAAFLYRLAEYRATLA